MFNESQVVASRREMPPEKTAEVPRRAGDEGARSIHPWLISGNGTCGDGLGGGTTRGDGHRHRVARVAAPGAGPPAVRVDIAAFIGHLGAAPKTIEADQGSVGLQPPLNLAQPAAFELSGAEIPGTHHAAVTLKVNDLGAQ
jgi:hypothetical protein